MHSTHTQTNLTSNNVKLSGKSRPADLANDLIVVTSEV